METNAATVRDPIRDHKNHFDHGLVKLNFLRLTKKFFDCQTSLQFPTTYVMMKNIMKKIRSDSPLGKKLQNRYEIMKDHAGNDILILKRNNPTDPILQVLDYNQAFDVLADIHVNRHHKDIHEQLNILRKSYWVYFAPKLFRHLATACNVCNTHKDVCMYTVNERSIIHSEGVRVELISMVSTPDGPYNFILFYQKVLTEYTLLRPVMERKVGDVSIELIKLFSDFGVPKHLFVSDVSFYKDVCLVIKDTWPQCETPAVKPVKVTSVLAAHVFNVVHSWMQETDVPEWSAGLSSVQRQINDNADEDKPHGSPYMALFGADSNNITVDRPSKCTTCKGQIYKSIFECLKCSRPLHLHCGDLIYNGAYSQVTCKSCVAKMSLAEKNWSTTDAAACAAGTSPDVVQIIDD